MKLINYLQSKLSIRKNYIVFIFVFYLIFFLLVWLNLKQLKIYWLNLFEVILKDKRAIIMFFKLSYFFLLSLYIPIAILSPLLLIDSKYNQHEKIDFSCLKFNKQNTKKFIETILSFLIFPLLVPTLISIYFLLEIVSRFTSVVGAIFIVIIIPISLLYFFVKYILKSFRKNK